MTGHQAAHQKWFREPASCYVPEGYQIEIAALTSGLPGWLDAVACDLHGDNGPIACFPFDVESNADWEAGLEQWKSRHEVEGFHRLHACRERVILVASIRDGTDQGKRKNQRALVNQA